MCFFKLIKFIAPAVLSIVLFGGVRAEPVPPSLAADIIFRCLWWSETQMEQFDPNAPPPKTTEVTIQKWEYTDPVGVPHPDVVDVVIELKNEGTSAASGIVTEIAGQWRIGPLKSEKNAIWSSFKSLKTWQAANIAPGNSATFRIPIDIATSISELEKKGSWPWMFRVLLTVRAFGFDKPLLIRKANLPIRPGD